MRSKNLDLFSAKNLDEGIANGCIWVYIHVIVDGYMSMLLVYISFEVAGLKAYNFIKKRHSIDVSL